MSDDFLIVEQQLSAELLESKEELTLVVIDDSVASVVETETEITLIVEAADIQIVESVTQGPPGPPGSATFYTKRIDIVNDALIYKGLAEPGSEDGDFAWAISRVEISGTSVSEQWADGEAVFSHAWNDRSQLTYL